MVSDSVGLHTHKETPSPEKVKGRGSYDQGFDDGIAYMRQKLQKAIEIIVGLRDQQAMPDEAFDAVIDQFLVSVDGTSTGQTSK